MSKQDETNYDHRAAGYCSGNRKVAFAVGISEVTIGEKRIPGTSGSEVVKDSIENDV